MKKEELKPCPFCGCDSRALRVGIVGDDGDVAIWCICGASIALTREYFSNKFQEENFDTGELTFDDKGIQPIIKKWNRRTP